jgi:hypothetical protein
MKTNFSLQLASIAESCIFIFSRRKVKYLRTSGLIFLFAELTHNLRLYSVHNRSEPDVGFAVLSQDSFFKYWLP